MNKETEIKILNIEEEDVLNVVDELSSPHLDFSGVVKVIYFHPHGPREMVRVRGFYDMRDSKEPEVFICYKKYNDGECGLKCANEYEIRTDNLEGAVELIEQLGYKVHETIEKQRHSYTLSWNDDIVKLEFDCIPGCVNWVEIEGRPQSIEGVLSYLIGKLKFGSKDISLKSTQDLYHQYRCVACKEGDMGCSCYITA